MDMSEDKIEVSFFCDDEQNMILIIFDDYYSVFIFSDITSLAGFDYGVGVPFDHERIDEYIEGFKKDGIIKRWTVNIPHYNYVYNIVKDWIETGSFDVYDYYGERPWHEGGV